MVTGQTMRLPGPATVGITTAGASLAPSPIARRVIELVLPRNPELEDCLPILSSNSGSRHSFFGNAGIEQRTTGRRQDRPATKLLNLIILVVMLQWISGGTRVEFVRRIGII